MQHELDIAVTSALAFVTKAHQYGFDSNTMKDGSKQLLLKWAAASVEELDEKVQGCFQLVPNMVRNY